MYKTTEMKKGKKTILNKICFVCLSLLFVTCQNNTLYHSFHSVDTAGWKRNDTLCYTVPSSFHTTNQQVEIGIRHKDSYPYRDIWLAVNQQNRVDTLHIYLAEANGSWKGNGIGETRQYTEILPTLNIEKTDSISVLKIVHIMEDEVLKGINDIGICLRLLP